MTLSEREKESMEIFRSLDEKEMERQANIQRYARYGADYEAIEKAEAERKANEAKLALLLDAYAISIWKAAWLMMAEGYENTEEGIEAFCAAHPQYQKVTTEA